jgi:hypothetical protein
MNKICKKCKQIKDICEFYKHANYQDGFLPKCKSCVREYDKTLTSKVRIIPNTKKCCRCKQNKEYKEFHPRPRNSDGLRSECKTCTRLQEKDYRTKKPDTQYYRKIKQKYNILEIEHHQLIAKFDGKCGICKTEDKLVIDHSHATGKIRGLLCSRCNTGLGMFGDNVLLLLQAKIYLETNANE